jgi:hypothetical protein
MQIVRYGHYPQSDLSAALERLTNMRAEMDRVFESTSSFSGSTDPLSRWNPDVHLLHSDLARLVGFGFW